MQKPLSGITRITVFILLAGCASPPDLEVNVPPSPTDSSKELPAPVFEPDGITTVGIGKSRSPELARNRATVNGRRSLQKMLDTRMKTLWQTFAEEVDTAQDSRLFDAFNTATQALKQQIQVSAAKEMEEKTTDGTVTAYALMELDPKRIMNQLAKEEEFYTRFRTTKAFEALEDEITEHNARKETLQNLPIEQ